ncbi:hypothetical protein [Streptomyces sp. YS-3]|uniref:hypothetical protein n=1 Tax=Streptomyces sp. YS-3 TaxID=3381352 RepID=UPI003862781C
MACSWIFARVHLGIDADLVVSDLAPLAQLFQRAGRGHRHELGDRGTRPGVGPHPGSRFSPPPVSSRPAAGAPSTTPRSCAAPATSSTHGTAQPSRSPRTSLT